MKLIVLRATIFSLSGILTACQGLTFKQSETSYVEANNLSQSVGDYLDRKIADGEDYSSTAREFSLCVYKEIDYAKKENNIKIYLSVICGGKYLNEPTLGFFKLSGPVVLTLTKQASTHEITSYYMPESPAFPGYRENIPEAIDRKIANSKHSEELIAQYETRFQELLVESNSNPPAENK